MRRNMPRLRRAGKHFAAFVQTDMVARKDADGHTTIFSESLYNLFEEGL